MTRRILFVLLPLLFGTVAASAQSAGVSPGTDSSISPVGYSGMGAPEPSRGVDIWQTLRPLSPQGTITQAPETRADSSRVNQPGIPYAPSGYNAGAFTVYPSITGAAFYDDNVFASNSNRRSDWAFLVRPELALRSNTMSPLQWVASAYVEGRKYARFDSEDQINGGVGFGSTLAIDDNTQFVNRLQYTHAHEDRGVSDTATAPAFDKPIAYDQFEAAGALNKRFNRVWTSIGAAGLFVHYQTPDIAGLPIDQSYRDGSISRFPVRLGYVIAPLTSVFVEAAANRRDFDVDAFSSWGYRVVGGMLFEPGPGARAKGEFYGGFMYQDYNGSSFQNVSTWTLGGTMSFLVTPRLTATIDARREAKEASLSGGLIPNDGVSVIETVAGIRADYVIMPNVTIGAGLTYIDDDFQGANAIIGSDRADHAVSPLASAKWFVNPNLTLGADYRYLTFDSSGFGVPTYYRNVFLLSANAKF